MIVLDTHAWIWWSTASRKLPARVRRRIDRASAVGVCAISCWEVGMLVAKGRLRLDRASGAWVRQALALDRVELLPLEPEIAVEGAGFADFGGDPADQMIIATARAHRAKLVTADDRISASRLVDVVW